MLTSDAIAILTSNTHFFSDSTYHGSVFIDDHEYLIYMTIIIPYKNI